MVQFIEVTLEDGDKYRLAIDKIIGVIKSTTPARNAVIDAIEQRLFVKETVQEILGKIDKVQNLEVLIL